MPKASFDRRAFSYIRRACFLPSVHQPEHANKPSFDRSKPNPKSTRVQASKKILISLVVMDMVLAFSILSSSPADVDAVSSWARLSWRGSKKQDEPGGKPAEAKQQQEKKQPPRGETLRPRFAPEFDGIDCFETIVSH